MKNRLSKIAIIVGAITMSVYNVTSVSAQEMDLPIIARPTLLEEGTKRTLTKNEINELLPWAKTSKTSLLDLLEDVKDMSIKDKINHLSAGINTVVSTSNPTSELFMRYILNRALVLQETLKKETSESMVGIADTKLRILMSSIQMAIKYYDIDVKMLNDNGKMTFAAFGANYFEFLVDLNKSIFDASAHLEFHKIILEWLSWDLYRDVENKAYTAQIIKIHTFLTAMPSDKLSDSQSLVYSRKMRDLEEKLNMGVLTQKIKDKSPARELNISERVYIKSRVTGLLREATVYANVSKDVPGNDSDNNTHYCLKFTNPSASERFMAYENFVKRSDIILASGCGDKFCAGEVVIEKKSRDSFSILGVDVNGDYAIRSSKTEMIGMMDGELAKAK